MFDSDEAITNGVWRRVFDDCVTFQPDWLRGNPKIESWDYAVAKYPLMPGFHVVRFADDDEPGDHEYVLSSHKTLHEAMGVCRVLLAHGGVNYD